MSPGKGRQNKFNLKGRKGQKDLELAYDYEYYYAQPEFPFFYEKIKALMEDKDTISFAWSSSNDIMHLYNACKRYKKEQIAYSCYDVQKIAEKFLEINKQIGLKKACLQIVGKNSVINLQEHLSRDDAKMTMMVLDAICTLERKNSITLLKEVEYAKDEALKFASNHKADGKKKKGSLFSQTVKNDILKLNDPLFNGKRYNLSGAIKKSNSNLEAIINKIHELNGIIIDRLKNIDYFVVLNEDNLNELKTKFENKYDFQFILLDDLMTFSE